MWKEFSKRTMIDPEHIAISKSKGIKIDWSDGHRSEYSVAYLRDECPCAKLHRRARNDAAEKQLRAANRAIRSRCISLR